MEYLNFSVRMKVALLPEQVVKFRFLHEVLSRRIFSFAQKHNNCTEQQLNASHRHRKTTFTVNGSSLEDLIAQGGDYEKYGAYVSDGYFHESELASAPAFDLVIDGITSVTE